MKKDLIFAPILLLAGIALFLLRFTGITAHIIISAVGIIALAAYTVLTKKEWKIPALEIIMRALYGIALVTGIIIMNVAGLETLANIHKMSAALFFFILAALSVQKLIAARKAKLNQ